MSGSSQRTAAEPLTGLVAGHRAAPHRPDRDPSGSHAVAEDVDGRDAGAVGVEVVHPLRARPPQDLPGAGEAAEHRAPVEVGVVGVGRQQVVLQVGPAGRSTRDGGGAPAPGAPPEDAPLPRRQQHPPAPHAQDARVVGEAALLQQGAAAGRVDTDRRAAAAAVAQVDQPPAVLGEGDAPRVGAQQGLDAVVRTEPDHPVGAEAVLAGGGAEDERPARPPDQGGPPGVELDAPVAVDERGPVDVGDRDVGSPGEVGGVEVGDGHGGTDRHRGQQRSRRTEGEREGEGSEPARHGLSLG